MKPYEGDINLRDWEHHYRVHEHNENIGDMKVTFEKEPYLDSGVGEFAHR